MFILAYEHIPLPPHTHTHTKKKSTKKVEILNKCSLLSPECHQRTAVFLSLSRGPEATEAIVGCCHYHPTQGLSSIWSSENIFSSTKLETVIL